MSLNYGYLFSTKLVAEDFGRYDNFAQDKKAFESIPNVNISRSMVSDMAHVDVPEILLINKRKPRAKIWLR
ncbi:hypothetical protein A1O7_06994 [Cladophialophora yegresii CBS 114405]|uniref:Uncharacterized protein n=1 Tax=Cladophialophora yegresii CBS 114405 TaxID=1182544 RepID=W9VUE6_9EURO|nr:uncharacterized protein A1O7_06994 [Cladophialophora yegresii CBS 114405]EXJ56650.1 hypothetical protein A1O7_06994 [Cladophialophora yegresii CBS 114405]